MSGRLLGSLGETTADDVGKRLNRQFDEHERLGDQVVATAEARFCPALKVRQAGHKDDWRGLVGRHRPNLGAELEAVHSRHLNIKENQVVLTFCRKTQGYGWIFYIGRLQIGFLQRIGNRPSGKNFVIHDKDVGWRWLS